MTIFYERLNSICKKQSATVTAMLKNIGITGSIQTVKRKGRVQIKKLE